MNEEVLRESFQEWKQHEITQKIMRDIRNRIVLLQDELGRSAGEDPRADKFKSGYITACIDFLNVDIEE